MIGLLAPILGLGIRLFGTRRYLARHLARDDLPSGDQVGMEQVLPEMTNVLLDHRDTLLVQAVARIHQKRSGEPIDVAVVYGAAHMPALTQELASHYGYRARSAEWLNVFEF